MDAPSLNPKACSYVRRKSSELRKMLPKSPRKAVSVLKHLWNQMYKSPWKRKVIDDLWKKDKGMGKFMYKIGKYKNKKDGVKLGETVNNMKKKYTSLRNACCETNLKWSQFHKCTKLHTPKIDPDKKYIHKLRGEDIKSISNFFTSETLLFPLPDKKYSGQCFMKKSLSKSCKMYNMLASTTRKICASMFRKYKPKFVKLQGRIPFRQSCCEFAKILDSL